VEIDPKAVYTRKQIGDLFGGIGPGVLPARDGHVICALFDPFTNAVTHLSGEIDVHPKTVPGVAKKSVAGADGFPAFIKVSTQFWRYAGEYKLAGLETSKKELDKAKKDLGREDFAAVLRFEPTKPHLMVFEKK
jgi:hypothetical protein